MTVAGFNALYYWNGARQPESRLVDWDSYFYPLDGLDGWNRIYGRQGFVQFQCVLPLAASLAGLVEILRVAEAAGCAPFLAVQNICGWRAAESRFRWKATRLPWTFLQPPETLRCSPDFIT
jgi:hypothetical protein